MPNFPGNYLLSYKTKQNKRKTKYSKLTNSTKAWLRLAPTLHLVLTILPKGLQSSTSSSSAHSHGRFRKCNTFDGVCVYRNWGWPDVDISLGWEVGFDGREGCRFLSGNLESVRCLRYLFWGFFLRVERIYVLLRLPLTYGRASCIIS